MIMITDGSYGFPGTVQTARIQPGRNLTFFGASFYKRLGAIQSHLGGSGHQNEIPCTHPPSPNPCDSEYDHFGACRTVSEAIGGLGRASPQGADAGEPLAIFLPFWDFWTIFGKCEKSEIRNQK